MEKLFIVCTFDCSFEYYEETIEKFVKEYGDGVVIDYELNKINNHKSHSFYNVTSLEAFAKILDNPFAREWDKANNCKDIVYKLEGPVQILVIGYPKNKFYFFKCFMRVSNSLILSSAAFIFSCLVMI